VFAYLQHCNPQTQAIGGDDESSLTSSEIVLPREPTVKSPAPGLLLNRGNLLEDEDQLGLYKPLASFSQGQAPALSCNKAIMQ
jgi:hypothetical protein